MTNDAAVNALGQKAMALLFGNPGNTKDKARHLVLARKIAKATSFVKPDQLPPTTNATVYHSYRTYYQVMLKFGHKLNPRD